MEDATLEGVRRNPAPLVLAVVVVLLLAYYLTVGLTGMLRTNTSIELRGDNSPGGSSRLTLRISVQEIDLTNRVVQATVRPIPHGSFIGERAGEIQESVRIEVISGGDTTSVVTFPGQSIIDPTTLTLALERGDTDYPFDHPFARFQLSVQSEDTGTAVPFDLDLTNSARPWILAGDRGPSVVENGRNLHQITLDGSRDPLSTTLVMFYVLAILLTTLMAVVVIGSALLRRALEFSNIIWLSATLLSFPALRSAMPGAPPIGTALDFIVLFPCLCIIAGMLVWTGVYLLWKESAMLRTRTISALESDTRPTPTKVNG